MSSRHVPFLSLLLLVVSASVAPGQEAGKTPSADEVKALLQQEPFAVSTWPAWRQRLTAWFGDKSRATDPAYKAAEDYFRSQADAAGQLPARFADDHLAWYFLANGYLHDPTLGESRLSKAEATLRTSIRREPTFARAHRNLALTLALRVKDRKTDALRLWEATQALEKARRLDPQLDLGAVDGIVAQQNGRHDEAERIFESAYQKDPDNVGLATELAQSLLLNPNNKGRVSARLQRLAERFPNDGVLAGMAGFGFAIDNRPREAVAQLARARSLGFDPDRMFGPDVVRQIERAAAPSLFERFGWIMLYFAGSYAVVMLLMAGAGVVLASRTRGQGALELLQTPSDELVAAGQVTRGQGETVLARLYGLALMVGLVLFYAAIPFVVLGLIGTTLLLLNLILMADRIPIKLVLFIVIFGGLSVWAVLRSLFIRPASGAFGLTKTAEQCPRVHQLLAEVAERVETDPVDEVYLAPGSAIGVHQEGRGPFGIFGVKRRVLTLGLSTMHYLTIGELKAILAHEYAHFSHRDTFYSRFIYQVHLSIEQALGGMWGAGGAINYANPFYWFLWLYYKCYTLLAAGYSRSREFLADRMAATLYGAAAFKNALTKVCTDGTLFEMTMYDNISNLLQEQKSFVNMYEAFRTYRDEQMPREKRDETYDKLLTERGSLFASHPTFAERIEAIAELPAPAPERSASVDAQPALTLFDQPEEIEKELTLFLTDYVAYLHELQALAAQQG